MQTSSSSSSPLNEKKSKDEINNAKSSFTFHLYDFAFALQPLDEESQSSRDDDDDQLRQISYSSSPSTLPFHSGTHFFANKFAY